MSERNDLILQLQRNQDLLYKAAKLIEAGNFDEAHKQIDRLNLRNAWFLVTLNEIKAKETETHP
jgi:hypothetical protein